TINSLTVTDIDTILISNSFHITIDNMIRGNANVYSGIPALAEDATTYPVTVITKTEITEFIIAAQQFSGVNFTNVTFSVATVTALTPEERDEVLDSMIVRNMLTNEIELIPGYVADSNNYMNNDTNTFLTEAGINAVLGL
ncbi:MAG: hypothetical protein RBR66_02380, partial [Candidatus Izemoplasmatales bacterium]|nr:hypothetical protein [Candidatus Izemoplasmatales bacterium]